MGLFLVRYTSKYMIKALMRSETEVNVIKG